MHNRGAGPDLTRPGSAPVRVEHREHRLAVPAMSAFFYRDSPSGCADIDQFSPPTNTDLHEPAVTW